MSQAPVQRVSRAFLHIGAPKTASTFLQGVLWGNRDALLGAGVHVLGEDQSQHYRAGKDLRGIPFDPADPGPDWSGAWGRMANRAQQSEAASVVISDEHLAALGPRRISDAVRSLRPREVHVIYATRDLPGLLPSEWQEYTKHGSEIPYAQWVLTLLDRPTEWPGRWFWAVHDVKSVVDRWASAVPREQIHVATMPASSAPRDEIWRRFASIIGVDPQVAANLDVPANPSLGYTSAEVLRRVNERLPDDFPRWHRTGIVRDVLANKILNPLHREGRPGLPEEIAARVVERAESAQHTLSTLGCDLVGDPAEIAPDAQRLRGDPPPGLDDVADVAISTISGLTQYVAAVREQLWNERTEHRDAENRLREEHRQAVAQALAEQQAYIWKNHPVAHGIQRGKERVVAAEDHRVVGIAMSSFRRLRHALRQ